jgi:hypothetical protein
VSCRGKQCTTCWLRRQLIGVALLLLVLYWIAPDLTTKKTALVFWFPAVFLMFTVRRHED